MDPRVYSGQFGAPDASTGDEGVNYLRRLKGGAEGSPNAGGFAGEMPSAASTAIPPQERRRDPRLRCSGSVEFRAEGNDGRMWGTLTDISMRGCYVEMHTTFPVGTRVSLVLKSFGIRIEVAGTVRVAYPFLGMGIGFGEIEPAEQSHLKYLLDALSGRSAVPGKSAAEGNPLEDTLVLGGPRDVLDAIAEHFQKNPLLNREEFQQIAKRIQRQ